ncbi:hypothetical protein M0R45_013441 [Rubus argutus]|uniref:Uncharacterized protein n=1 Tax=Rubus argutus TaxID=59490 RepID=A0AAW1XK30_RUBAR
MIEEDNGRQANCHTKNNLTWPMMMILIPLRTIPITVIIVRITVSSAELSSFAGGGDIGSPCLSQGSNPKLQLGRQNRMVVAQIAVSADVEHGQFADEWTHERVNTLEVIVSQIQVLQVLHIRKEFGD